MIQKTRNQHHVPQLYLRKFTKIDDRLNVYDKKANKIRLNQRIDKICSESFFYDLSADQLIKENPNCDPYSIRQFVDEFNYSKDGFFQFIENEFSITDDEKGILSNLMAIQYLRTKKYKEELKNYYISCAKENLVENYKNE